MTFGAGDPLRRSTWSPSPAGSCCSSARPRSSRACSTPAARARTATRASASCSCSCSSGSSPSPGSFFVQTETLEWEAFALAVPVGLLAAAVLVVNNVRDVDTDRRAGKRTLAVRLGRARTPRAVRGDGLRRLPADARSRGSSARSRPGCCCRSCRCRWPRRSCERCASRTDGPSLNEALARTGRLELVFCVLLGAGVLLS